MGSTVETLSIEETADILGISKSTAYEAAREGKLPVLRFGRCVRVVKSGLNRMIDEAARMPTTAHEAR